jgi:transcription elongation factor/antiterminator RfaH
MNTFRWYAVRTRSNHEQTAAHLIGSKGYEHFLPTYFTRRRWSDRVVTVAAPLFPGYVFCRFDAETRLPIISTPGVVSIVGCGKVPAPIEDAEISAIQKVLTSKSAAERCPFLQEGQRVSIKSGSMAGVEGILLKNKAHWRIVVSVSLLQRSISVEVDRDWLEPI